MPTLVRLAVLVLIAGFAGPAVAQAPLAQAPAIGPAPPQTSPGEAPVFLGLRFPDAVAGFPRGRVVDFEKDHPGLGYDVKYSGRGWVIDVFIYDAGLKDIPDSLSSERVIRHFSQARGDIFQRQQAENVKVEEKESFQISTPRQQVRFICGAYLIAGAGRPVDSFLCLTTWNGKFVKYRLSTLQGDGAAAVAKRFVGSWIDVLWPAPGNRRSMPGKGL